MKNPLAVTKGLFIFVKKLSARRWRIIITAIRRVVARRRRIIAVVVAITRPVTIIIVVAMAVPVTIIIVVAVPVPVAIIIAVGMPTFPILSVAAFVFSFAIEDVLISEMRPLALLLNLKLIVRFLDRRGLSLPAENQETRGGGD